MTRPAYQRSTPRALLAAGALLAAFSATGAPPPLAAESFGETTDVVVVEVPVYVHVDGEPVRGLEAEDFVVLDGRKKQRLTGFSVVDLAAEPAARPPGAADDPEAALPPIAARRHFLLLFDLSFARPSSIVKAREAAREVVEERLHTSDLVAVASYTLSKGPNLVLGFTPDRSQALRAIETLGLPELVNPVRDPLGFQIEDMAELLTGGPFGGEAAETLRLAAEQHTRDRRRVSEAETVAFSTGFADLAKVLRGVGGRKYLVLLSEGFDASTMMGTGDRERTVEINQAAMTGEYWRVDSEERFGNTSVLSAVDEMIEELRLADCVVQAVDVGGLRAESNLERDDVPAGQIAGSGRENSLFLMANETGGELFRNFNDLGQAMAKMLERTSVTYLLAFQPEALELDGSFHKLKVKLEGGPKGAEVLHRPGYYAPKPYAERTPLERRLGAAERIAGGGDGGEIGGAVLAVPFRASGGPAYVPVLVEIDGPSLLAGHRGRQLGLEVYGYAFDRRGALADFFSQSLEIDVEAAGEALRRTGAKFYGHLDLPAGDYRLRVLVRDAATGRSSLRSAALRVPAFDGVEPVLLEPLAPEPIGRWVMLRENVEPGQDREVPFPFMMGGQPYVPAARPTVAAGGGLDLSLVAYHLGAGPLSIEGRLLGAGGLPVEGARLSAVGPGEAGEAGLVRLAVRLEPGGAPPGEYRLEVELTGGDGASSARAATALEIVR